MKIFPDKKFEIFRFFVNFDPFSAPPQKLSRLKIRQSDRKSVYLGPNCPKSSTKSLVAFTKDYYAFRANSYSFNIPRINFMHVHKICNMVCKDLVFRK